MLAINKGLSINVVRGSYDQQCRNCRSNGWYIHSILPLILPSFLGFLVGMQFLYICYRSKLNSGKNYFNLL